MSSCHSFCVVSCPLGPRPRLTSAGRSSTKCGLKNRHSCRLQDDLLQMRQLGNAASSGSSQSIAPISEALIWKRDDTVDVPVLVGTARVDWLQIPVDDVLEGLSTLKEGICRGVLRKLLQHGMVLVHKKFRSQWSCREQVMSMTGVMSSVATSTCGRPTLP